MIRPRNVLATLALSATVLSAAGCNPPASGDGPSPLGLASQTPDAEAPASGPGAAGQSASTGQFTFPGRWHALTWTTSDGSYGTQVPIGWTEQVLTDHHRVFTSPGGQVELDLAGYPAVDKTPAVARRDDLAEIQNRPGYQPLNQAVQPGAGALNGLDGAAYDYLLDRNGQSTYYIVMWIGYQSIATTTLRLTVSYPNAMSNGEKGAAAGVFSRAVGAVTFD